MSVKNACNVNSDSKLVKPLTICKPVCLTIVSKSNIYNMSIASQHVKPLNVSKSMSSCNVHNRNVHVVDNISHYTRPLSVGKSDCYYNVSKPDICKSSNISVCKIINNHNVSSHRHGVTKSLNVRNILMMSIYFYELVLLFFIFHPNFCHGNVDNFFKDYVTHNNFSRNNFLNYDLL